MKLVLLGAVARAHGVAGEVQVHPFHAESPLWRPGTALHAISREALGVRASEAPDVVEVGEARRLVVRGVRPGANERLLVAFDGIGTREAADRLHGAVLGVAPEALGSPGDGEFWYWEVAGFRVVTTGGVEVGTVVRAVPASSDLLEVRPAAGGETFYVPVVPEIVLDLDREGRRVVVDPPEGLLP